MLKSFKAFLNIIRWPNLLFIFLTQLLFEYCVVLPPLWNAGITPQVETIDFLLIAAAYQLLAASGYIINDYFDLSIDVINKPDKVFIGNGISKNGALTVYAAMNVLALALAATVGLRHGSISLIICIAISEVLLLCYSAYFKKKFLIGNVVVAVITASAIPALVLMETSLNWRAADITSYSRFIMITTIIYTGFAIIISFARELVKDLEDVKGDHMYGGRTIPIVLGTRAAHVIVILSLLGVVGFLIFLQPVLWSTGMTGSIILAIYSILLIIFPLLWMVSRVFKLETPRDYHRLSTYIKAVMFTGILSMVLIQYLLQ